MTLSMTVYDYLVTGVEPEMVLEAEAPSDVGAWRDAVMLVSEIMREKPVLESGSFTVKVEVKTQAGRPVCCVEARSQNGW
ncbi:hypothetical protein D3C81_1970000 [compost metagenome]|jgi:hypothetical protein|nr:hypothetical protein [uncultured Brevundimonas sp.]